MLIGFVCLISGWLLKPELTNWPMPGRLVKRATYENEYHQLTRKRWRALCSVCGMERSVLCRFHPLGGGRMRSVLRSVGPTGRPDPTIIQTAPKPDYFFCGCTVCCHTCRLQWRRQLSSLARSRKSCFLFCCISSGEGEKSWRRRPIAVLTVLLIAIILGTLTHLAGLYAMEPAHERLER